ncbi:sister chromatid cohesion protein 1 [Quaeritorhiza haematococci]|nr:sister chromatid cohesion protein 1 [Quaeritorhiza haematococci]
MLNSDAILYKKGPLARVWLAAHWERKLSKSQFLQANIQSSVAIIQDGEQPITLRISGQLLLGVARIYSRKAKYLLEDCNDAMIKIKLAFRPGVVDLSDEQAMASFNSITLADTITEFDILLPEPALDLRSLLQGQSGNSEFFSSQTVSRIQDITISENANLLIPTTDDQHDLDLFGSTTDLLLLEGEVGAGASGEGREGAGGDDAEMAQWDLDFGEPTEKQQRERKAAKKGKKAVPSSLEEEDLEEQRNEEENQMAIDMMNEASFEIEVGRDAMAEKSFADDSFSIEIGRRESAVGAAAEGVDTSISLPPDFSFEAREASKTHETAGGEEDIFMADAAGGADMNFLDFEGKTGLEDLDLDLRLDEPQGPIFPDLPEKLEVDKPSERAEEEEEQEEEDEEGMFQLTATSKVTKQKKKTHVAASAAASTPSSRKRKLLLVDDAIELPSRQIMNQLKDTSDIVQRDQYVPTSRKMLRLVNMQKLGVDYYLNRSSTSVAEQGNAWDRPLELRFLYSYNKRATSKPLLIENVPEDEEHGAEGEKEANVEQGAVAVSEAEAAQDLSLMEGSLSEGASFAIGDSFMQSDADMSMAGPAAGEEPSITVAEDEQQAKGDEGAAADKDTTRIFDEFPDDSLDLVCATVPESLEIPQEEEFRIVEEPSMIEEEAAKKGVEETVPDTETDAGMRRRSSQDSTATDLEARETEGVGGMVGAAREDIFGYNDEEMGGTLDGTNEGGLSRSTVRTINLFQSRFGVGETGEGEQVEEGATSELEKEKETALVKELSFKDLTSAASRTDTVRLFFELLVLKTKDLIDVEQKEAYGDVAIRPRDSLFVTSTSSQSVSASQVAPVAGR